MKKIFTLMAAALFAASASAQVTWVPDGTAPDAGTKIIDNDLVTVETVYETAAGSNAATIGGLDFTNWIQLRTSGVANADDPTGGKQSDCTPLIVTAKQNADLTLYYRRQYGNDGLNNDDNKDVLCYAQNGKSFETSEECEDIDGSYGYAIKTIKVVAGGIYTIYRNGSTVRLYGVNVAEGTLADEPSTGGDDQGNTGDDEPIEGAYIAWVYSEGYGAYSYAFETDPVVIALKEKYNVVAVSIDDNTNPTADEELNGKLLGADVVVVCEAMTGNKTMSNSLVNYVGQVPVVALKAYNYNDGRWNWGAPANPNPKALGFTPKSNAYNVLEGVTYEEDGTVKVATSDATNVIQTVSFGAGAPEDMVIMGTVGGEDTAAAMYASKAQKFFGLGLSSDCWNSYTANAGIIVKNAVTMLIAGEDLTAVGDETGIQNVVKTVSNGAIYNLAGQKVDENYKGVVIKNGKKVVLK